MFKSVEVAPTLDANIITKLFKKLHFIKKHGEKTVLYVTDKENVIANYQSRAYYVTQQVLEQMVSLCLITENVFSSSRQLISTCLFGLRVACSGLSAEDKRELAKEVLLLGGVFVPQVHHDTSVLITNRVISTKVFQACDFEVPIVSPDWVHACFSQLELVPFNLHSVRKFEGLTITSSDLTQSQRTQSSSFVRQNGGTWSDAFDSSVSCIIAHSLFYTKKIGLALEANVPIISPEWIIKQSEKNFVSPFPYILNKWCCSNDKTNLFESMTFSVDRSLSNSKQIEMAIEMNSGTITPEPMIRVARHGTVSVDDEKVVSPQWVWTCIADGTLIDAEQSPVYQPLPFKCPIAAMNGKCVAVMNMTDKCRLEISSVLRDIGITVIFGLSKVANVIVAQKVTRDVRQFSQEYDIPMVSVTWVMELIKTGDFSGTKRHLLFESNCLTLGQCSKLLDEEPVNPVSSPITEESSSFF